MNYNEIVLEVSFDETVPLSDALIEAGAMAVTVEDAEVGTTSEKPIFGEPGSDPEEQVWDRSRIIVLLAEDADIQAILYRAAAECGLPVVPAYTLREVPSKDWVRETQAQFDPISIGTNIWVVPSWHDIPDRNAIILQLDPGLAFGTGSHPTTRLCLEWLEKTVTAGATVLDYGCGSGILAIAAKKLGAAKVVGVDIDPQAVLTAQENATINRAEINAFLPDQFRRASDAGEYDIVAANILSGPLQQLAPMLSAHVKKGGRIILSGILEWQKEAVIAAYAPWIPLSPYAFLDGWVALSGTRH